MVKHNKLGKGRLDKYYWLAKEQGYRSRAAFKLVQIDKQFRFLKDARVVIDLCAAPGGWMQVAANTMPMSSVIVGVDLDPIKPVKGCIGLQSDITTQECRAALKKHLKTWQADAVLNDGAPNVGGAWDKDSYLQCELSLMALKLAAEFLRPGGVFVSKVFRSKDYTSFLWVCQQLFKKVTPFKPSSSRATSAEIFLVCEGYLAPGTIDPRLFKPEFVFRDPDTSQSAEKQAKLSLATLQERRSSRKRGGYDDQETQSLLIYSKAGVTEFVKAEHPILVLARVHELKWDGESEKQYGSHALTTGDVRALLSDTHVLSKSDLRKLLGWRLQMRKLYHQAQAHEVVEKAPAPELTEEERLRITEEKLEEELDDLEDKLNKKKRSEKRKRHELRMKQKRRVAAAALDSSHSVEMEDLTEPLFSMAAIRNTDLLDEIADADTAQIHEADVLSMKELNKRQQDMEDEEAFSDSEVEEGGAAFEARRDVIMSDMYQTYKDRKNVLKQSKAVGLGDINTEQSLQSSATEAQEVVDKLDEAIAEEMHDEPDSVLERGQKLSADALTDYRKNQVDQWFSGELFDGIDMDAGVDVAVPTSRPASSITTAEGGESGNESDPLEQEYRGIRRKRGLPETKPEESDDDDDFLPYKKARKLKNQRTRERRLKRESAKQTVTAAGAAAVGEEKDEKDGTKQQTSKGGSKSKYTFEEVPMPEEDGEFSDDSDAIAETLALGRAMLNKRRKNDMIDSSYNRFAYDDNHLLPQWFQDDERVHKRTQVPITRAEVDHMKSEWKAVNARPIKKVAEAKARKKMKAAKHWENAKAQANSIASNEDISSREKVRAIARLYAKNRAIAQGKKGDKKQKITFVVANRDGNPRGATGRKGERTKVVDTRMKADLRGMKNAKKRQKKQAKNRKRKR